MTIQLTESTHHVVADYAAGKVTGYDLPVGHIITLDAAEEARLIAQGDAVAIVAADTGLPTPVDIRDIYDHFPPESALPFIVREPNEPVGDGRWAWANGRFWTNPTGGELIMPYLLGDADMIAAGFVDPGGAGGVAQVVTNTTNIATNTTNITTLITGQAVQDAAIALNTAKVTFPGISAVAGNQITLQADGIHVVADQDEVLVALVDPLGTAVTDDYRLAVFNGALYYNAAGFWAAVPVASVDLNTTISDQTGTSYANGAAVAPPAGPDDGDLHIEFHDNGIAYFVAAAGAFPATASQFVGFTAAVSFADATTASDDAVGAGGIAVTAARSDHKHAAQGVSADAEQLLKVGADGLHMLDPDDLVSADANNELIKGTDGRLYSPAAVFADAISPAADDATGAIGVLVEAAREDHKHPAQAPSADAGNKITAGTDGLHNWAGDNRVHATNTAVAPATAGVPTEAEISAAVTERDVIVYYTGDDLPASPATRVYHVDASGVATELQAGTFETHAFATYSDLSADAATQFGLGDLVFVSSPGFIFRVSSPGTGFAGSAFSLLSDIRDERFGAPTFVGGPISPDLVLFGHHYRCGVFAGQDLVINAMANNGGALSPANGHRFTFWIENSSGAAQNVVFDASYLDDAGVAMGSVAMANNSTQVFEFVAYLNAGAWEWRRVVAAGAQQRTIHRFATNTAFQLDAATAFTADDLIIVDEPGFIYSCTVTGAGFAGASFTQWADFSLYREADAIAFAGAYTPDVVDAGYNYQVPMTADVTINQPTSDGGVLTNLRLGSVLRFHVSNSTGAPLNLTFDPWFFDESGVAMGTVAMASGTSEIFEFVGTYNGVGTIESRRYYTGAGGAIPTAANAISPAADDAVGAIGVATTEFALEDHKHPAQGVSADAGNSLTVGTDGLHFAAPVSTAANAIPPAADDAVGAIGAATTEFALEDHKHPAQGVSADAFNRLSVGTDGLHQYAGSRVSFLTNTGVAPATAGSPTDAEAFAAAGSGATRDIFVYYTGDDVAASTPTHAWFIGDDGTILRVLEPATAGPRVHLTATAVAAALVAAPTLAEIQAAVTAGAYIDRVVYYTSSDIATDQVTHSYVVDSNGDVTPAYEGLAAQAASRHVGMPVNFSNFVANGAYLDFSSTVFSQGGDLSVGPNNGIQGLVAGKTYKVTVAIGAATAAATNTRRFRIRDEAAGTVLGTINVNGTTTSGRLEVIFIPAANTEITALCDLANGSLDVRNDLTFMVVEELAAQAILPASGLFTNDDFAANKQVDLGDMRVVTGTGTGGTPIVFANPFSAAPIVFVTPDGFTGQAASASVTTTGFTPQTSDSAGSTVNQPINWMAVGAR